MINPETISKDATKKEFAKFVEDFNTGELSSHAYVEFLLSVMRIAKRRSAMKSIMIWRDMNEGWL